VIADIDARRAHHLGLEGARAAAEKMAQRLGKRFGLRGEWNGNVLAFERPGVTGALAIGAKEIRLTVTLGLLLKAVKPSIERAVLRELDAIAAAAPRPKKAAARRKKGA
jgi:putative polyhydroxyalkanoate system protein